MQTEIHDTKTEVQKEGQPLGNQESPWEEVSGIYADIPDDLYEMYLQCIHENREERDRNEEAEVIATK